MADRKISDLTALTAPASGDYLPIVDISEAAAASKNKRITIEELFRGVPSGTAAAPSIAIEGDEDTGVYSPGANQLAISTAGSGRLFVNSSGQVGVGTANQSDSQSFGNAFEIRGSTGSAVYSATSDNATRAYFATYIGGGYLGTETNHPLIVRTNNTERIRITSAGLVGIGTTNPLNKLVVSHNNGAEGIEFLPGYTSNRNITFHYNRSGATYVQNDQIASAHIFRIASDSTQAAIIDSSGRLGVGTSSPSEKLQVVSTGTKSTISIGDTATNTYSQLLMYGGSGKYNWSIGAQYNVNNAFEITPSTATGGTTFSSPALVIDSSSRVGIGTTSPSANLHVATPASGVGVLFRYTGGTNNPGLWIETTESTKAVSLYASASNTSGQVLQLGAAGSQGVLNITGTSVGIGTTSPNYSLDIAASQGNINLTSTTGTNNALLRVNNTGGTGYIGLDSSAGGLGGAYSFNIWHSGNYPIVFANNNTPRATIDSSGRLLVGTSSALTGATAQYSKNVNLGNSANATGNAVLAIGRGAAATSISSGNTIGSIYFTDNGAGEFASIDCFADAAPGTNDYPGRLVFSTTADGASSPTERMRITKDGHILLDSNLGAVGMRVGSAGQLLLIADNGGLFHQAGGNYYLVTTGGGSTSDINLKKEIAQIEEPLQKLKQIRGVTFSFIDEQVCSADQGEQIGVIAQEVEKVFPQVVVTGDDGVKSVRYDKLTAPLIEAVNSLALMVEEQSTLIQALVDRVAALERV